MKKSKLLLFALFVASVGFFSSCEKDEDGGPTIDFFGGEFIDGNTNVEVGATLNFKLTATSDEDMSYIEVEMDGYGVVWDEEIAGASENSYTKEITITAPSNPGTYTYNFVIYNSDDEEIVSKSIVITVGAAGALKAEITNVKIYCTLGDGSGNSTCASADGTVYSPKTVSAANQAKVDFVYFYDTKANIYAPSAIPSTINGAFTTWTTKNATKIAKSTVDYATATFAQVKAAADAVTTNKAETLVANDVVAFKTAAGKVGIFKVNSIQAGYTGSDYMIISIKVEQ